MSVTYTTARMRYPHGDSDGDRERDSDSDSDDNGARPQVSRNSTIYQENASCTELFV